MDQTNPRPVAETVIWPTVGRPGVVPVDTLVPDREQPRKYFSEDELQLLAETMKAGGQREIITVRELTPEEQAENYPPPARYMIVSGERRWRAAKKAQLNGVEIRVKRYESRREQMLDAYMLNEGRVGLSDIEHAYYIADLMKEYGWQTQLEIAEHIGRDLSWVSTHLSLLKLSPVAQMWMKPDVPEDNRLKMQPALVLARNVDDPAVQDDLIARMPKKTTAVRQIAWIHKEFKLLGIELRGRKRKPSALRDIIFHFAETVGQRVTLFSESAGMKELFDNATQVQTDELVTRINHSLVMLQRFLGHVRELADIRRLDLAEKKRVAALVSAKALDKQRSTPPESLPLHEEVSKPKSVPSKPISAVSPRPVKANVVLRTYDLPPMRHEFAPESKPPPAPRVMEEKITPTFFGDTGRYVTSPVSLGKYIKLWDKGLLKFQKEGTEKPDFLPTREEAVARLKAV